MDFLSRLNSHNNAGPEKPTLTKEEIAALQKARIDKVENSKRIAAENKALEEEKQRQLKEEAADIVRNTVPNYAYVSDTVRALRRLPLGTFMSFPSEILRTTTNIAQRSIKEIKDPALRNIGIKRLVGLTTVLATAPYAIQKVFKVYTTLQMKKWKLL